MPEEVLFETERTQSRSEIATYLRTVADKLEDGESVTLTAGDQTVTLTPPERPTFEVKSERETGGRRDELSLELEIEWKEGDDGADGADGSLDIE
ncbi:amphi-Trp domain-containing protein [halophilic archaeon]|nr:amphi-Trp domain-containing protein [halophilic archaeon]